MVVHVPRAQPFGGQAPRRQRRVPATVVLAVATTVWVIDRVHGGTTRLGPLPVPAWGEKKSRRIPTNNNNNNNTTIVDRNKQMIKTLGPTQ